MADSDSGTDAASAVPAAYAPSSSSEDEDTQFRDGWDASSWDSGDDVPWTMLPISGLVDAYGAVVAPARRRDGYDARDRPSYEWLAEHGFRGLTYALREYHELTLQEFWTEHVVDEVVSDGYDWPIDDEASVELLEAFLERRQRGYYLSESTVDTYRYRLARYARAVVAETGQHDLVGLDDVDDRTAAEVARDVFDRLDETVGRRTLGRIHEIVNLWYEHLVSRGRVEANPVDGIEDDYLFKADPGEAAADDDNPTLSADDVRSLVAAATDTREELLVVALAGWGLRTSEVAALRHSQFVLEGDDPHIAFDERKNGPGRVSLLFGRDVLEARVDELASRDEWAGWLFPSDRSASGHVTRGTVARWFGELVERAGVTVNGDAPTPQLCRRFWYDRYTAAVEEVVDEVIGEIAAEQGSSSGAVVLDEYLSPDRRRQLRRETMRAKLADAFEVDR